MSSQIKLYPYYQNIPMYNFESFREQETASIWSERNSTAQRNQTPEEVRKDMHLFYGQTASIWSERNSMERINQMLEEVRAEAEEERCLDKELDPIPESAYEDVRLFCKRIDELLGDTYHAAIHPPEPTALDNGEICLEWREKQQIFTLNFGGDGHIVFAGIFSEENRVRGILTFSLLHVISIVTMILSLGRDYGY